MGLNTFGYITRPCRAIRANLGEIKIEELAKSHHEEQLNSRFLAACGFSSKTINGFDGSFMDWIFTWHLSKMDSMLQLFNTNDWKLLVSGLLSSYLGFPTVRLSVGILAGSATWIRTSVPEAVAWDGTSKTLSTQNHHQYQQNQSSSEMSQFPVCFFFPGDEQPFTSSFEGTRVFDPWPKSIKQFYDDLVWDISSISLCKESTHKKRISQEYELSKIHGDCLKNIVGEQSLISNIIVVRSNHM